MNIDEIKELLDLMREHQLSELEVEREGHRVRLTKDVAPPAPVPAVRAEPAGEATAASAASAATSGGADEPTPEADGLTIVKAPIVGTFYRSPDPSAAPFVEIGDTVEKGQALCIIEAMKLMNEIDSECEGQVVDVYVESGQPVQYGERLFAVRPL